MKIFTIGHSNRKIEEFLRLLKKNGIEVLIDVRRFPSSKKFPWFNKENLSEILKKENIEYIHFEKLGGFRKEGYENYSKTKEFEDAVKEVLEIARNKTVCIMCAEKFYWKCHRRFIINKIKELDKEAKIINLI